MFVFTSAFGKLTLNRWPLRKNDQLQAWDAADEYLLNHLAENNIVTSTQRLLIINDTHGALSCAMHKNPVTHWSDSSLSQTATVQNSAQNQQSADLNFVNSTEPLQGIFDVVLIKIPKTNALLEDQLIRLRPHITKDTVIIAAAMVKHLQKSAFQSIEKYIGPLTTSLAAKKARLIFTRLQDATAVINNPYPDSYNDLAVGMALINHANVFSRDHLDIGTRFLLSTLDNCTFAERVIDLACGNGVLGIKYQQLHPDATLQFVDESYMAIESARQNYSTAFPDTACSAQFFAQDGLTNYGADSVDLILCNPPFHQQHAVGEEVANKLFNDAKRCLSRGGQLWIVANHHLGYNEKLKHLFGHCRTVDKNKKFVVLQSTKRS